MEPEAGVSVGSTRSAVLMPERALEEEKSEAKLDLANDPNERDGSDPTASVRTLDPAIEGDGDAAGVEDTTMDSSFDMEIERKIESLSHPSSSELLNSLTDNEVNHHDKSNDNYKDSNNYSIGDITNNRMSILSDSSSASAIGYGYSSNSPARNRSNSRTSRTSKTSRTSSGTRTIRNSSNISPASKIFRNLLILEDDLRNQAREQRFLRLQYISFYSILMGIAGFAVYELYFSNNNNNNNNNYYSQDKSNQNIMDFNNLPYAHNHQTHPISTSQSIYRFVLQFTLVFIVITLSLFHISGQYRRTIILPRRFLTMTNRGIKQFNLRLVRVHSSWDERFTDLIRLIMFNIATFELWIIIQVFKCSAHDNAMSRFWQNVRIQSQPRIGAVDVKLVLSPRAFSSEVREGWDIYRDEFWAREGARRRKPVIEASQKKDSAD